VAENRLMETAAISDVQDRHSQASPRKAPLLGKLCSRDGDNAVPNSSSNVHKQSRTEHRGLIQTVGQFELFSQTFSRFQPNFKRATHTKTTCPHLHGRWARSKSGVNRIVAIMACRRPVFGVMNNRWQQVVSKYAATHRQHLRRPVTCYSPPISSKRLLFR
jgi:hypothetical protein